jgi:hypothetical protein
MPADIVRLQQLRSLAQHARCEDNVSMTEAEIDELVALERQHEAEKAAIRAEARQQAEARSEAERQQIKRPALAAGPYVRRPSSRMTGLELIRRGLGNA